MRKTPAILSDCLETTETVITNGVEVLATATKSFHGGGTSTSIRHSSFVTRRSTFTDYDAYGRRIAGDPVRTNSLAVVREQLTGLSDACRRHVVEMVGRGVPDAPLSVTETTDTFDVSTGILTTTTRTDGQTPVVTYSIHGVPVGQTDLDEIRTLSYDAFGRNVGVVAKDAATGATNRVEAIEYDVSGNVVCRTVDYGADGVAIETAEFDILGRETSRTDALGGTVTTARDATGRPVAVDGDTHPLQLAYDTTGRKTDSDTTHDGVTWDNTHWDYDHASGVVTNKTYADGSHVAYAYTAKGQRTRTTWARGAWRENSYNDRDLVSGTTYSGTDTPSVAYAYADSGKLASATLSDGTACTYAYDDSLLCTNEAVVIGDGGFAIERTFDALRRDLGTAVVVTNVRHAAKTRLYDNENRVCGYALTNAAGRGVSVSLAYDGLYLTNMAYALPNGGCFSVALTREAARRELVMHRAYAYNGQSAYWHSTDYDLIGRPTNATDSVSLFREWLYNPRSELAAATIGTNRYGYAYDSIGNRLWSAANAATNSYSANSLNQYTSILCGSASPCEPSYDADGNLLSDGAWSYAYDAENRLVSATSAALTNGAIRVLNAYDHKHRRVCKTMQRLHSTMPPPPSPPVGEYEWQMVETHMFVWDGNNIILEKVEFADGTTRTFEYFWGADKSGTEQGAGGVEGLLAVSMDGVFYIPCYDHNGNIVLYVSETGSIAAQYTYDPYGNIIESSGPLADVFSFGFSTQYHDRETGMVGYKRRFYRPDLGRWLNRDPIEDEGGENLYAFCQNNPTLYYDVNGCWAFIDNVVAFVTGAVIGAGLQAASDIVRGEVSGWETYVGAAVAGGVVAEVLLHVPTAVGMSKAIYGGAAAAAGNLVKQTCEVFVSKKSNNYDWRNFSVDTFAGASLAMIPFPKVPHVTAGRGSYLSVARRINTQYANGTISHVSAMTTIKSTVGVATEYGVAYNVTQPMLLDVEQKVESALTIFYYETISIRIVDKCGNVVDVTYQGEFKTNEQ